MHRKRSMESDSQNSSDSFKIQAKAKARMSLTDANISRADEVTVAAKLLSTSSDCSSLETSKTTHSPTDVAEKILNAHNLTPKKCAMKMVENPKVMSIKPKVEVVQIKASSVTSVLLALIVIDAPYKLNEYINSLDETGRKGNIPDW